MDHARPIPSLFPGARGAVLDVLTRVQRGMTIRQLADRAGVSHPQVSRHVADLERLGIIRREHVGRSHVITLTDTLATGLLRGMTGLRENVVHTMQRTATSIEPRPVAITLFGSFARGDDHADSDIDVLVVVDDAMPEGAIDESLMEWCRGITEITGNAVAEIVVTRSSLDAMDHTLHDAIERDGIPILRAQGSVEPRLQVVAEERAPYGP